MSRSDCKVREYALGGVYDSSDSDAGSDDGDAESEWANAACACVPARDAVVVWKSVTFCCSRQRHEHRF